MSWLYFFPLFMNSFLYDGARINDDDTPDSLDMEDNGELLSTLLLEIVSLVHPPCRYDWCHGRTWGRSVNTPFDVTNCPCLRCSRGWRIVWSLAEPVLCRYCLIGLTEIMMYIQLHFSFSKFFFPFFSIHVYKPWSVHWTIGSRHFYVTSYITDHSPSLWEVAGLWQIQDYTLYTWMVWKNTIIPHAT